MSKIRLNINGKEVRGFQGQTVLEIARENGIEIPTLCHDERLETYGACGLCVVEIEGNPKLARACATVAANGMVVDTMSEKAVASRKTALELLLSDHVGDCKGPCMLACPGNTDCQGYVGLIANGEMEQAIRTIKDQLPMPACIGRVCPHPCETACRRELVEEPIAIAQLKYFAADTDLASDQPYMPKIEAPSGKKIAIVGGGPGGMSSAFFLRQYGHEITVYDAMDKMGGMLRYGIPQYRLPKSIVDHEVKIIENMGVKLVNKVRLGKDISLETLRAKNDAVILAVGAWNSMKLGCKGEDTEGVVGGIEFLRENSLNHTYPMGEKVAIVGGGNTAMDACRSAVRMGAKEVYNIYRRTKEEMPAEAIEILEAEEEGVIFKYLVSPIEIVSENGRVKEMILQKMELGEPDESGRRRPVPMEGKTEILPVDCVISAIGQILNPEGLEGIQLTRRGTIAADEHAYTTNMDGVFAIGDATNKGADIAIAAIGEAKRSTSVINSYLNGHLVPHYKPYYSEKRGVTRENFLERERIAREKMAHLKAEERRSNFEEVNLGFTMEQAKKEGSRCLECGCMDVFECKLLKYAQEYEVHPEHYEGLEHHREEERNHPFIEINPDKCILCGQCVRTCEEVLGIGALGLMERGFDTIVRSAFNLPLEETGCISCGQCVSVCPTGALQEKVNMTKPVPMKPERTASICDKCSIGCRVDLNTKQKKVVRIESRKDSLLDDGQLCVRGRFGHKEMALEEIKTPMIRKNDVLVEATWEEALSRIGHKAKSLVLRNIPEKGALLISDRYTNEELYLAKKFAAEAMKTPYATSFGVEPSVLKDLFGYAGSANSFDELLSTELVVLVGTDIMKDYAVLGMKLRKAVGKGVKLILLDTEKTQAEDWATKTIHVANETQFLKGMLKAIVDAKSPASVTGLEELKASLASVEISTEAAEVAQEYLKAKKAILLYDEQKVSDETIRLLASMAATSGHIGGVRDGLIQLHTGANTQGARDMGLDADKTELKKNLAGGNVEFLLVLGEDLGNTDLSKVEFLAVQDYYMTDTAKQAHVLLPAQTFEEMEGTYTSSERRIQSLKKALPSSSKKSILEILTKLYAVLEVPMEERSVDQWTKEMARHVEGYYGLSGAEAEGRWNCWDQHVLYTEHFHTEDKMAHLAPVATAAAFKEEKASTNAIRNAFDMFLKENRLA